MTARTSPRIAWSLAALTLAVLLTASVFLVLSLDTPLPEETFAFRGWGLFLGAALTAAGVLIATRVSSNPIGWLLLVAGVGTAVQELAAQYANYGVYDSPGAIPAAEIAAWVPEWIWIPYMVAIAFYVPLLYPDGRLLSPRWRPVLIVGTIGAAIGTAAFAFTPGELSGSPGVRNPFGLERATWMAQVGNAAMFVFIFALAGAIASLGIRLHRSSGDERQQLKWLLLAFGLLMTAFLLGVPYWTLGGGGTSLDLLENVLVVSFVAIPVSIGFAILKYRLYDIDVVIKKTVVFGVLAILLFAIGVVTAWATAGLVVDLTGSGEYSWLFAGLVVGVAIWPLRRLATRIADRLVYGRRATPYQVLTEFSGRVADTYAADDVLQRMAQVLGEAVGADAATVWLGAGAKARPVATWPDGADTDPALPTDAVEIRHQGSALGALAVRMSPRDPMTPARDRLIRDLAGQAGLVLRNAALIENLRASRQRLVAAQDQERRRLERNIHDGAQQQLVALAVKLGLVERTLRIDTERAATLLAQAKTEAGEALETLRDLARGIYPPLLADEGLAAALTAQARKSVLRVSVESDGIGRYPQEAEAAVYFSCLEALQNVGKHAGATSVTVRLGQDDGHVTFEIVDDGHGFDPEASSYGTGLQGIADRLAALGGELTVTSTPGRGTTVAGWLPIGRVA